MSNNEFYDEEYVEAEGYEEEIQEDAPCDVVLCYDRETLQPVIIPEDDRFLNMLIMGPTGTGKSSQVFTPLIYQDLINGSCGITVIDPKEDLAESIYAVASQFDRHILYVDPGDENCPRLNPFDGPEDVVTKNMLKIFSPSFMITSNEEKRDMDMCRNLITKSIKLLKELPDIVGNNLNIVTFNDFISNRYNESRLKLGKTIEQLRVNRLNMELTEICEWFLYEYFEPTKDVYDRCAVVRIKVDEMASNKYLKRVMTPSNNSNIEKIDFNKHLLNKDIVIMNTKNTILGPLGKTFGEFIMLEFLNATFRRKHYAKECGHVGPVPPHFLYIDEFATYSPVLTDMFTQGRSFRVGTHIAVQNRALLQMCGEEDTSAQSLLIESNARNLVLFPGLNGADAAYYSAQFYNLKPEEICYRPFGQICYRVIKNKSISRPGVGLVFFIDQQPNTSSIKLEQQYKTTGKQFKKI